MSLAAFTRRGWAALASPRVRKRLVVIITNSANSLLVPLFSPMVSVLVVRLAGIGLWGDYVTVLVVAQLVSHIIVWGNKDYVLREFARSPAALSAAWQTSTFTRLPLLLVAAVVLALFGFSPERWLLVWLLAAVLTLAQSFEVFVLYRRDFMFGLGVEVLTVTLLAAPIVALRGALTVDTLLLIYIVANVVETGVYYWRYRREAAGGLAGRFELAWLRRAWPFFLLGFSGLLQSRMDLYAVTAALPRDAVGHYQIYTNQMIYVQSVSAFVLVPFVKSLYRLSYRTILALSLKLGLVGVAVAAVGVPAAALVLHYVYALDFALPYFAAGVLFVLPIYFYLPIIYALFKVDKALWVVAANVLGVLLSLALNLWWLPIFGALGAAWASAATQWALLLLYLIWSRPVGRVTDALPVPDLS
jgi:O-antigen/teichoic acid export membrane protein